MVVVVLDPPWLKGVYERRIHEGAHNVFSQLVLAEGTVTTVVAYHKELQYPETASALGSFHGDATYCCGHSWHADWFC